ncbi:hypothetical protein IP91_04206 [Pseudoduganella lurida]|uniref:Uncharacterized protein n=1 Tax=Pseudoduganella lurida TaxID=1036180 RepID=A0A562QZ91_9BURK|nr:hypothetical protein [Pseudoduganella lurida]TWI62097.1 hypothetical protein IP91_04206 [Pseudoduganella lurida]
MRWLRVRLARMAVSPWAPLASFVAILALTRSPWGVPLGFLAVWWLTRPGGKLHDMAEQLRDPARWTSIPPDADDLAGHASTAPRQIGSWGELGMGGPEYGTLLLPDGAILHEIDGVSRVGTSALYLATKVGRGGNTVLVYDSATQRLHDLPLPASTPSLTEQRLRAACAADPSPIPLHRVLGLLLAAEVPVPAPLLERRLRNGRLLTARLLLPADLRGAGEPETLLHTLPYQLSVDGHPTAIYVSGLEDCHESPSGDQFAVRGILLRRHRVEAGLWHHCYLGRYYTVQAHASNGEGTFFLDVARLADGGAVTYTLDRCSWGPDGRIALPPPSAPMALDVHWQRPPLRVATRDRTARLQLPERLPDAALDYSRA